MKNPKHQLLAFCLAAVMSVGVFILVDTVTEFRRGLATVDAELVGHVHLLAEHAQLSFRGVDILLSSVAAAFRRAPPEDLLGEPALRTNLQHALEYVPQLSSLAILDTSGAVLTWMGKSSASALELDGAEIAQALEAGQLRYIGTPLVEQESGTRFIPISLRISSADGEFYGAVLALLDTAYFHHFHKELDPEANLRVGMYLKGGAILTLSGLAVEEVSFERASLDTVTQRRADGSYLKLSPLDGSTRIIAYHRMTDYPVSMTVSQDYRSLIRTFYWGWARRALLFLALIIAVRICYKAISRSITTAQELRENRVEMLQQQRRFERLSHEIIHHIPNGRAALLDLELRYVFADGRAFRQHERLAPSRVLGKTVREAHRPEVADILERLIEKALETNEAASEVISSSGVFYEVTAVPLRDEQEQIDRVLLLSQDITSFHRTRQNLEAKNQELHEISVTDALLGIRNRRAWDADLVREWARAQRNNEPLSVLMIDVDHFKIFNDTYGHAAGDVCLQRVADAIGEAVYRPGDVVARYGGEEIAVLLRGTDRNGALEVAERIHFALKQRAISFPDSPISSHVTLSVGVASVLAGDTDSPSSLVHFADRALYRAKQTGRNRTCAHETEASPASAS